MIKLDDLYEKNKKLDEAFSLKYNFSKVEIINKNKLELLCELGELANSSRCFKYWSSKETNYNDMLYEYVDGLMMIFTFFNINNKSLEFVNNVIDDDEVIVFLKLYNLYNDFINHNMDNLEEILGLYLHLGKLLKIGDVDLNEAFLDKVSKTLEEI